jgi:hypothetical protein
MPTRSNADGYLFAPSAKHVVIGARLWYANTYSSWAQCRIVELHRTFALIEPVAGELRRRFRLSWPDLFWEPVLEAVPDRPSKGRRGPSKNMRRPPQPIVVTDEIYGPIDVPTARWLDAARRDRDA